MRKIFKARYIVLLLIILTIGGFYYRSYKAKNKPPTYETVTVKRENLKQTVDATGKVESETEINLRFEAAGTIERLVVKEGAVVKAGDELANTRLAELDAAVAVAQANLDLKLAGATSEDRQYYAAALASAENSLEQSKIDFTNSERDVLVLVEASLPKLDDSLTQADNILGVDNINANADFKINLGVQNPGSFNNAVFTYTKAKTARNEARSKLQDYNTSRNSVDLGTVLLAFDAAFTITNELLSDVSTVLKGSVPSGSFTSAILDAKKTTIETARNALFTQYTSYINQKQTINEDKSTIKTKQAAYDQALANYNSKINPPRAVDVAPLRATLAQALANRNKAIIRAPISGVVIKVHKKIGETVSGADNIIQMLSPHYEVKVDIPETDVTKIKTENAVEITLDAFGEDVKFSGKVISIDPGSTEIQDVVYYKVKVSIEDTDKPIKPGMTANVSIGAAQKENVLSIPFRAIKTRADGSRYVRVLEAGQPLEKNIILGMRADEGKVEVVSGLNEGESVIVVVK